ncbi:MAG: sigma-70 family RNA polymerase sigma factor [Verrucomicrobiota bacterium]
MEGIAKGMTHNHKPKKQQWISQLATKNGAVLLRYAESLCKNRAWAEEAVQETFMKLMNEESKKLTGRERPWLFRVCRSRVVDITRKENRMTSITDNKLDLEPDKGLDPSRLAEQKDSHKLLERLMSKLPEQQGEVLRLKYMAGMSYKQISDVTSLSVTNVGFILHTALKTLRTEIKLNPEGGLK